MKKTKLLFVSMSMLCAFDSYSQTYFGKEAEAKIQSARWIEYSSGVSRPTFIEFNPSSANFRLAVTSPVEVMKQVLSLKNSDDLIQYKQESDEMGFKHTRYQQTFKGIPVQGAIYIAHQKAGLLDCVGGLIMDVENVSVTPALSEATALSKALTFVGAKKYKWENSLEIEAMREAFDNPNFNYDPKGTLVIYPLNNQYQQGDFRLAYKFNIYAAEPESRANIYVDAHSGEIVGREELMHTADVEGTAHTRYSGTQKIITDQVSSTSFRLRETKRGNGIQTFNCKTGTVNNAVDFTDSDNDWNNANSAKDDAATDAHWATEMTYDYYKEKHNRNSIDNAGYKLVNYVHVDKNWFNATWNGQYMQYGDGNGNPLTGLDIGGHEMTHGVTSSTADLVYSYESGALNESFSDIFGTCVEWYAKPNDANWDIGEDVGALRNMQKPNSHNNPDTYKGTYWATGSADEGGVHTNSGVQNKWFYILVKGEKGTNDNGDAYDVTGIDFEKASKIALRNLVVYLGPNSNYAAARTNSLKAAKDLYGECSPEYISTGNAWYAVGVGAKLNCAVAPVADFSVSTTNSCDGTVKFTDKSSSSPTSWAWDFGDGGTSTQQNPTYTYKMSGTYTVKLTATNANGKDDETKTSYITVNLMTPPTTKSGERCGPGIVKLSASGGNTINWYTSQIGGTAIYTGTDYSADITATTTYYVENSSAGASQKVGPADNSLSGSLFDANDAHGIVFDVLAPCTLKSVKVYAGAAGDRIIEIWDKDNNIVKTKVVDLPEGESRVSLDFDLDIGTAYFIKVTGNKVDLFRAQGGASYPYTLTGLISLVNNDVPNDFPGYYYFFYDWEVQPSGCTSSRVAVTATLNPEVMKPEITENNDLLSGPSLPGLTYQWYMNGNQIAGATNQTYVPTSNGNYTLQVSNGKCSSTSDIYSFTIGIHSYELDKLVTVYPNPVNETIFIDIPLTVSARNIRVEIYAATGKLIYQETYSNNGQVHKLDVSPLKTSGIYLLRLQSGDKEFVKKITLNR